MEDVSQSSTDHQWFKSQNACIFARPKMCSYESRLKYLPIKIAYITPALLRNAEKHANYRHL
jgi:hypothetical protein